VRLWDRTEWYESVTPLPAADLGMAGMVAEALSREQRAATVEVVIFGPVR
jgi:hypothetical protein